MEHRQPKTCWELIRPPLGGYGFLCLLATAGLILLLRILDAQWLHHVLARRGENARSAAVLLFRLLRTALPALSLLPVAAGIRLHSRRLRQVRAHPEETPLGKSLLRQFPGTGLWELFEHVDRDIRRSGISCGNQTWLGETWILGSSAAMQLKDIRQLFLDKKRYQRKHGYGWVWSVVALDEKDRAYPFSLGLNDEGELCWERLQQALKKRGISVEPVERTFVATE